ncbi:MAG TPA: MBL fold metallo-hydrolase [Thermoanaerobaculia bacterium]
MENTAPQRTDTRIGQPLTLAPDVACVQLSIVNVYLVGEPLAGDRSWVLVDAGLATSEPAILRAAEERFGPGSRPSAIVLTHGHFDHVGSLRRLAERWDVPVYAHSLEMPYLTGRSDYPPPDPTVGGGAIAVLGSRTFPRHGINLGPRVRPLPADGSVPGMPGWLWIHTPGHTAGHVSLFREEDRLLIAGDAFVTTRQESVYAVMTRKQEVWRPPAYFTTDWVAAKQSVQELAALQPNIAATGHGIPMTGQEMLRQLAALARDFDRVAVPPRGRYVRQPALTDEHGVVSVPPPARDPMRLLLAAGAAAALGTMLFRGRSRGRGRRREDRTTDRF